MRHNSGGRIKKGQMLGTVSKSGSLRFYYQHVNDNGQLRSEYCESIPEILSDCRIQLREYWQWLDGKHEKGTSIVEEIADSN